MINDNPFPACESCAGRGFFFVHCVEHHRSHYRRKGESGFAIIVKKTKFKQPCDCLEGDRWLERRSK